MSDEDDLDGTKPIDPQKALRRIVKMAPQYAKAKAELTYVEEYRKTVKALAMREAEEAGHRSAAAQEREAYCAPAYIAHLNALREAVEQAETLRWRLVAAEAAVEVWRSQEASNRRIDRGTQ